MENPNILTYLNEAKNSASVISVFSDKSDPSLCSVGFVEVISDEQVLIKHIAIDGLSDGFVIRRLENVYRIDVDGRYEHKIHRLYSLQNQHHEDFLEIMEDNHSNLFKEALLASKKHELIVKLYIDETEEQEDIIGFVKAVNDNEAIISRIADDGSYDGESVFYLNDIIKLDCGRQGEIIRQLLYREEDK